MSVKTPGQAAYEAAEMHSPYGAPAWDDVNEKLRAAWEAAAQAAIAFDTEQRRGEYVPAITGAGTEHLARQLLDERDPDGPAWQPVPVQDR